MLQILCIAYIVWLLPSFFYTTIYFFVYIFVILCDTFINLYDKWLKSLERQTSNSIFLRKGCKSLTLEPIVASGAEYSKIKQFEVSIWEVWGNGMYTLLDSVYEENTKHFQMNSDLVGYIIDITIINLNSRASVGCYTWL